MHGEGVCKGNNDEEEFGHSTVQMLAKSLGANQPPSFCFCILYI